MPARRQVRRATLAPRNGLPTRHRILLGIPTLGTVRIEWRNAMNALVTPTNFQITEMTPTGFLTADAQNLIANEALDKRFDWVLLVEDDTLPPPDLYQRLRPYVESAEFPVVAGLYNLKTIPTEPMVYRGRGNGPYTRWRQGDVVRCDGVPTGCTLIAVPLLRAVADWRDAAYALTIGVERRLVRRVFETPRDAWQDPATGGYGKRVGTSDLDFCDAVMAHGLLARAGWPVLGRSRWPYVVDTRIRCGHIDRDTGVVY